MLDAMTFGRKIAAGFALALILLVLVGGIAFYATNRLLDTAGWVSHTHEVMGAYTDLIASAVDVETAERGFLLTGDERFLQPFERGKTQMDRAIATVRRLTADNPGQQARSERVQAMATAIVLHARETIALRREQGRDRAAAVIAAGGEKRRMDALRQEVAAGLAEEAALLRRREVASVETTGLAHRAIGGATVFAFVAVGLFAAYLVRSLSRQIGTALAQLLGSSTELQAAASQQAQGSGQQASSMAEVSSTMRELMATSRQIVGSAQHVAGMADDTAMAARTGDQAVARARDAIDIIRQQVDQIVAHMVDLGRTSQQIGGVLEIINELADQTNILAVNATIEAAGAGEHGPRFAAVADEIRRLADRVGGSTREVRHLVDEVRAKANTTVMATEHGSKAVDAGSRQFEELGSAFGQIVTLVGTTADSAREIELSIKQQSTAVEQINLAVSDAAQAAKETEASTRQTLDTAVQLTRVARELGSLIRAEAA